MRRCYALRVERFDALTHSLTPVPTRRHTTHSHHPPFRPFQLLYTRVAPTSGCALAVRNLPFLRCLGANQAELAGWGFGDLSLLGAWPDSQPPAAGPP